MRYTRLALLLLLSSAPAFSQHHHAPSDGAKPAQLIAGLGELHHPVSTRNAEAQRFFDQGLALVYGFNHEEAIRSFKRAAELDPELAMAHWGVALALGPNINLPIDREREKLAYEAIQKAISLASKAPEEERAYINALAKRYTNDPGADLKKLDVDYRNAMRELVRLYPDDLDAATLYAESIMDLRPWQYWSADGRPAEDTAEIVAVLEGVLKRDPQHIGANHYYIHAVEASPNPEWALPSAQRLKVLAPAAGHLVHMPAHIDIRTGNYEAAARSNAYAAEADRELFKLTGAGGMYPMMYYSHNLHFLSVAHSMQGRFEDAARAANQLEAHVGQYLKDGPAREANQSMMEAFMPTSTLVLVRFRRWDEILKAPQPDKRLAIVTSIWHFSRALAYAASGDVGKAESEQRLFDAARKPVPETAPFGANTAKSVLDIAEHVLRAKIAVAKKDSKTAIELFKKAIEIEDNMNYTEPPDWYLPVRESLGGTLLLNGNPQEAEQVFRADLKRNARNGRSLFGLAESLRAQGRTSAAQFVQREYEAAWKKADSSLRIEDL